MVEKMDTITTRFVIRPSESLKTATAEWQSDLKELLLQTSLWTKTEGQRTTWKMEDTLAQVKLLFLGSLKDYTNITDFENLVGVLSLSVRTFDRWWTIEEIDDEELVEEVEKVLEPSVAEHLEDTGRPAVDEWISDLRAKTSAKARELEPRPVSAALGVKA
jgi:hypothetical protein